MKSKTVRKHFFDFFTSHGHTHVPSSSLIPAQDPTLLFANAGMNQFKDIFLGNETRKYTRAVSIQKCVRAGGKHNDLDNVGFTNRHLTFFEMMGNFSFNDYFKKEAITFAWQFLTENMQLDATQMHATVYKDDQDAYTIWRDIIQLPAEKIHRLGEEENFWQMGDTGPCGPCSELFIDRGSAFGCKDDDPCGPACECDRFLEIWNLVFMQYNRQSDGSLAPLKQTGVDTGMGLERLCTILQKKDSIYETDLFTPIIAHIERLTNVRYQEQDALQKSAFHVLADHIRSASLLIADGCAPSNVGRGYVLRKIIRRAALFAQKLTDKNIFPDLSQTVIEQMKDIYQALEANKKIIFSILKSEIEKFSSNLARGKVILDGYFSENQESKTISGKQAFTLYDTYGFPVELTVAAARERGYHVDADGFDTAMQKQKEQSGGKKDDPLQNFNLDKSITTEFTGYKELETCSTITALIQNNEPVQKVDVKQRCWVITKQSPFFIVGGGQVPDQGWITVHNKKIPVTVARFINNAIGVEIETLDAIHVNDTVTLTVDAIWRTKAMKNHTATHLLQSALIQTFGKQIKQSGSLVHPDYLRFDFTYHARLSSQEIISIEQIVNQKIQENIPVTIEYTTLKDATKRGVIAFFGDKYKPERVRIVQVGDFSAELCGGTHVHATGDIGAFKIIENTALSAGHRRIVALTGPKAIELFQEIHDITKTISSHFKVKQDGIVDAVTKQHEELKQAEKLILHLKEQLWQCKIPAWIQQTEIINRIPFLCLSIDNTNNSELRDIATHLQQQNKGLILLISTINGKTIFFCSLAPEFSSAINLKEFALWLKEEHNLRGGVQNNTLQGGGTTIDIERLKQSMIEWIKRN